MHDYSITFACYNSVEYTKQCVSSLVEAKTPMDRVVVVDNGSHDGTRDYLADQSFGKVILNKANLGCGVAWNQGALEQQSDWTIVMNNDVLVTPQWAERLIDAAIKLNVKVISPAMIEGPLDYDFQKFATNAEKRLATIYRQGARHAVCLAVHKSVWADIGISHLNLACWVTRTPCFLMKWIRLVSNQLSQARFGSIILVPSLRIK